MLNDRGQVLIDSTDILYMFDRDEDGGVYIPAGGYYGELGYTVHYKGESEEPITAVSGLQYSEKCSGTQWLFCRKVLQDEDSFLARLTL